MLTDIIVVKYNVPEVEVTCIRSILRSTHIPYNLTVFDNYVFKYNLGQLWNRLIKQSEADYICLLNSDTSVSNNWLSEMLEAFDKIDNVGCVGPTTDNSHNQQSKKLPKKTFVDFGKTYPGWCLSGFCLLFPKKIWEEIGGFPEDFGFYGQEVVLIDKMTSKGYKQIWRTDVFVHHDGGASVKKAQEMGEINESDERKKGTENYKRIRKELLQLKEHEKDCGSRRIRDNGKIYCCACGKELNEN